MTIKMSEVYTHKKNKDDYMVVCVAMQELDMTEVVVYQSLKDSKIWTRPYADFMNKFVHKGQLADTIGKSDDHPDNL